MSDEATTTTLSTTDLDDPPVQPDDHIGTGTPPADPAPAPTGGTTKN